MLKFKKETLGHRVLIKPQLAEKQTASGIIVSFDNDRKAAIDSDKGTIVAVGPQAYKDFGDGTPWVKEGDFVYYAKYGAKVIKDSEDGEIYVICNDDDILLGLEA